MPLRGIFKGKESMINKSKQYIFFVTSMLLLCFVLQKNISAQETVVKPLEQTLSINSTQAELEKILISIARISNVPIGFDSSIKVEPTRTKITYFADNKSLRTILDELLRNLPEYTWSFEAWIINIYPKEHQAEILNVRISELLLKDVYIDNVGEKILTSPDIISSLGKLGYEVSSGKKQGITDDLTTERISPLRFDTSKCKKIDRYFQSLSLKEVLNELLKRREASFWVLNIDGEKKKYISLTFQN